MVVGECPFFSTKLVIDCFLVEVKNMAELTLTMRVRLIADQRESEALSRLCDKYTSCCNDVSDWIGEHHTLSQRKIGYVKSLVE